MSLTDYKLNFSEKAEEDFEDILLYTLETWGEAQMLSYRDEVLNPALEKLQKQPYLGYKRPDLSDRHRALSAGQHVIVYQLKGEDIFISRILHNKMDFPQHAKE